MKTIKSKILESITGLPSPLLYAALFVSVGCGKNGCGKNNSVSPVIIPTGSKKTEYKPQSSKTIDQHPRHNVQHSQHTDRINSIKSNTSSTPKEQDKLVHGSVNIPSNGYSASGQINTGVNQPKAEEPKDQSKQIDAQLVPNTQAGKHQESKPASSSHPTGKSSEAISPDINPKSLENKLNGELKKVQALQDCLKKKVGNKLNIKSWSEQQKSYIPDVDGQARYDLVINDLKKFGNDLNNQLKEIKKLQKFCENKTEQVKKQNESLILDPTKIANSIEQAMQACQEAEQFYDCLKTVTIQENKKDKTVIILTT